VGQYLPIFALLIVATLFAAISLVASKLLAPRNPTAAKRAPYECGIVPSQDPPERFPVRFYLVAMSFIVFDIEIIFLYPWAVIYRNIGAYGLIAVVVFSLPIFVSLAYEFSQGALDWGPSKQNFAEPMTVAAPRDTSTTVRQVGLEGRAPRTEAA
jgi:NADH-quinone oxidoreductase subunit A